MHYDWTKITNCRLQFQLGRLHEKTYSNQRMRFTKHPGVRSIIRLPRNSLYNTVKLLLLSQYVVLFYVFVQIQIHYVILPMTLSVSKLLWKPTFGHPYKRYVQSYLLFPNHRTLMLHIPYWSMEDTFRLTWLKLRIPRWASFQRSKLVKWKKTSQGRYILWR